MLNGTQSNGKKGYASSKENKKIGEFLNLDNKIIFRETTNGKFILVNISEKLLEIPQQCLFFYNHPQYFQIK